MIVHFAHMSYLYSWHEKEHCCPHQNNYLISPCPPTLPFYVTEIVPTERSGTHFNRKFEDHQGELPSNLRLLCSSKLGFWWPVQELRRRDWEWLIFSGKVTHTLTWRCREAKDTKKESARTGRPDRSIIRTGTE